MALVTFCAASVASAHLGHLVQRAERYLKVDVSGYRVRLVVSLTLGARETARLMQQADSDGNGWVSPEERDAYMGLWGAGLVDELAVRVDGTRVDVEFAEPFMQPIGAIVATEGSVEMVGTFVLDGGEHDVVIADTMPREAFERTDYSFRARDEAVMLASGLGDNVTEVLEHTSVHQASPNPETFMVRVRVPQRPLTAGEEAIRVLPWAAGAAAVLIAVAVALQLRRRSRVRAASPTPQ